MIWEDSKATFGIGVDLWPGGGGGGKATEKFLAIGDSNTSLKQEGLQPAETSFRGKKMPVLNSKYSKYSKSKSCSG